MKNRNEATDRLSGLPAGNSQTQTAPAGAARQQLSGRGRDRGRPSQTLPCERIRRIHLAIESGSYPNASTLAASFGVSTKTIGRDLDYMQSSLRLPLVYDSARFGYYYSQPATVRALSLVSEADLFALLVAERALAQYRGSGLELALRAAFQKLLGMLNPQPCMSVDSLRDALSAPDSELLAGASLTNFPFNFH